MCFLPQSTYPQLKHFETPGIFRIGRMVFLLTPFNSFINGHEVQSFGDFVWILLQNVANIFLLTPLILGLLFLIPRLRSWKRVFWVSFLISCFIEGTQLVVDLLFDANRVFETDDLMTNTVGGLLAYGLFLFLQRMVDGKGHRLEK
ncbi:VanZF-related protein [Streptococcus sp. DD13]|nr:VanZF-related protein [Streptococcus sp. DD13]